MAKSLFVIAHPEPKGFNHALVAEAALEGTVTGFGGVPTKLPV
jgi:hypothetical protein